MDEWHDHKPATVNGVTDDARESWTLVLVAIAGAGRPLARKRAGGALPLKGSVPSRPADGNAGNRRPFPAALRSHSLPPGTLITVWLKDSLAVSNVRTGDTFNASVAEPLTIDGETVIDRGILVRGRVESAPPSADPRTSGPDRGPDASYVRLTLNSITVGGKVLDLQTSTLFAKDTLQPKGSSNGSSTDRGAGRRSSALGIRKGRRLTFRLTSPVTFNSPNSVPNRQDSDTTANK